MNLMHVIWFLLGINCGTLLLLWLVMWNGSQRYSEWLRQSFKYEQEIRLLKDVIASHRRRRK